MISVSRLQVNADRTFIKRSVLELMLLLRVNEFWVKPETNCTFMVVSLHTEMIPGRKMKIMTDKYIDRRSKPRLGKWDDGRRPLNHLFTSVVSHTSISYSHGSKKAVE